jgi:hypothetical protein
MIFSETYFRNMLATNQDWLERAVLAIDERQTFDERQSQETKHRNAQGWNSADARYGGYLARYIRNGNRLSGSHVEKARRIIRKYAGQLVRIARAKANRRAA